ncbi:lytic polysaccharide monooxygenase [Kitasatospora sp. NPDC047058]|uniref:lytic polysaccharide monooxygenase n=1 Tax=Kitasatospora sp. NPDC047058 TaxID=3155620 RepID=UPI0034030329
MTFPYSGVQVPGTVGHTAALPGGRTGHQVVVAVREIADTGNAFHSCTDVRF